MRLGLILVVALLAVTACSRPSGVPAPRPSPNLVPDAVVAAARAAIDEINDAAGGDVADQRAVFERLVAPREAQAQDDCPPATTTLAFDPAYRDLRPVPDGDVNEYLLPTYISIFTGDRITGSDVATIRLWIADGSAVTAALCVA